MVFEYLNTVNLSVNKLMERIGIDKFGGSVVKAVRFCDWIVFQEALYKDSVLEAKDGTNGWIKT